jgi:hypothetical protein
VEARLGPVTIIRHYLLPSKSRLVGFWAHRAQYKNVDWAVVFVAAVIQYPTKAVFLVILSRFELNQI